MGLEEISRLCSVKDPKGKSWEHMLVSGEFFLRNLCVSHSSSGINFLQFVEVCYQEPTSAKKHGDESGNKFNVITLKTDEPITSVSGHHWFDKDRYVLNSLTFRTKRRSYGPFGSPDTEGNEEFNFEVEDFLIGFHGTTFDGILESFGVILGVLQDYEESSLFP